MIIVKTRIWRVLYYLLKENRVVTANEMAEYVDVSVRTIKSDMPEIKELAQAGGCEIVAYKANGYQARIVDKDLYEPMKTILIMNFSDNEYCEGMDNRGNDIARHLLMQQDWIKEETLADMLYISTSTLKTHMKQVKSILDGFNLSLLVKPGYGIKVEGIEINRRFAMLELLIKHHHKAISIINYPEFESLFVIDEFPLADIRKVFLQLLRNSGLHVIDSNSHRLLRYVALMYKRNALGFHVHISEQIKKSCQCLREYFLSCQAIETLHQQFDLPLLEEDEIYGLTILLLYWIDIDNHNLVEQNYGHQIYMLAKKYSQSVFDAIDFKWHINIDRSAFNESLLIGLFVSYAYRTQFKEIGYHKYLGRMINSNDIAVSPLCLSFASCAMQSLQIQDHVQMNNYFIFELATRLHHMLQTVSFPYKKRNIVICMRNGIDSGYVTRQILFDAFGKDKFDKIKFLEFYDLRGINQDEYDCVLLNSDIFYYTDYKIPAIICNTVPTIQQRQEIKEKCIQEGYQYEGIFESLKFDTPLKVNSLNINTREEYMKMVIYRFGLDEKDNLNYLYSFNDLFVYNETVTIIVPKEKLNQSVFEVNHCQKPCNWCGKKVNTIIFISVDLTNNIIGAHLLQCIVYGLMTNTEFVTSIDETSTYKIFTEYLKKYQTR